MRKLTSTRHDPLLLFSICRFPASGLTRILLFAALCVSAGRAQVDVLTGNYNNKRTNANLNETVLIKANVSAHSTGRQRRDGRPLGNNSMVIAVDMTSREYQNHS